MKHSSRRTASHSKKSRRKVKDTNRTVLVLGGILFFYLLIFAVHTRYSKKANTVAPQPVPITMTFVGDIMFDRGVKRTVKNHLQGSYDGLYANASYLTDVDIAFANLEGPVGTSGYNVGSRFSFHMEESGLRAMKTAGFDIVSFANNHVGDYTVEAFLETLDLLKKLEIRYSGAGKTSGEVFAPTIIEVRGTRIGFLSASDVGPTWLNATEILEWSGFFEGAAVVHWALVRGAAQGLNHEGLMILAEEAVNWHYEMIESELATTGQNKALL